LRNHHAAHAVVNNAFEDAELSHSTSGGEALALTRCIRGGAQVRWPLRQRDYEEAGCGRDRAVRVCRRDVTANLRTLRAIPLKLRLRARRPLLEVRGEC